MDMDTQQIARVAMVGVGATVVMDAWLLLLKAAKVPTLNFAYIGRWFGHLAHGRWSHDAIARSPPIRGELAIGWGVHYATGIAFAALLVAICGGGWLRHPQLLPALALGIGTVLIPFLVMQPAMGAGIASRRTPTPLRNIMRSIANHAVFGTGLYLAATVIDRINA